MTKKCIGLELLTITLSVSLSDTLIPPHTQLQRVSNKSFRTVNQVFRVVNEDECIAIEIKEKADMLSQW